MAPLTQHLLSWLPLSSRLLAPLTASNAFDTAYQPSHDLEQWIERERVVAVDQLFGNIGERAGASPGVIIASPSTSDPDYFFTWTRDANLIASGLLEVLPSPSSHSTPSPLAGQASDTEALSFFSDYIDAQLTLQHLPNPSGTYEDLTGLGEPKFHANLTVFEGRWGRPQRDGPALRALAVLQYAEYQSARGQLKEVAESKIVKLLKADLDYVAAFWNCTTFDLWEETLSSSFFTTLSHFHALSRGSAFFSGERGRKYENEAKKVRCFLGEFWVEKEGAEGGGWWRSNWNVENGVKRSGLDANSCALLFPPLLPSYVDCPFFSVLGALLHPSSSSSPSSNPCDSQRFGPCSDRMLANHLSVVESFRGLYPINTAREAAGRGRAIAVGRYREDVYYGGNPWYLTTLAAASQLYRALSVWTAHGELNVTNTSLPFFRNLLGEGAMVGRWKRGEEGFGKVLDAVRAYADEFLEIVREYTPEGGALAEQFDEHSGEPRGARDLTWSYIAFLTAAHARSAFLSAAPLPSPTLPIDTFDAFTCPDGGDYAGSMKVKFEVEVQTQWGEAILLTGSAPSLGSWDPSNALALSAHDYTRDRPVWTTDSRAGGGVGLPGRRGFEFKFIKRKLDGTLVWEGGENRVVYTSSGGERTVSVKWHG
ncbi:hypothetical protein JCM1841_001695 [Sporobolomyces salmonicolor]